MTDEEQETCRQNASFLCLEDHCTADKIDVVVPPLPATNKNWRKDVRPAWDRMKARKQRDSDLPLEKLVFALRHRVCGQKELVKLYLCGCSTPEDDLLTYANYADGSHPDYSQEEVLMDALIMRQKPVFSLEEMVFLSSNLKLLKKTAGRKRLQGGKVGKGASGANSEPLANKRLLNKVNSLPAGISAVNVVRYNIEKGVGLKTVDIPHLQGAKLRYMLSPIPVVASDAAIYSHVLDIIYQDGHIPPAVAEMKQKAKVAMEYLKTRARVPHSVGQRVRVNRHPREQCSKSVRKTGGSLELPFGCT